MLSGVITLLAIFGFKKKGLGLERAKDCCSANALEKNCLILERQLGGVGALNQLIRDWRIIGGEGGDSFISL